jgi:hypothetical protein
MDSALTCEHGKKKNEECDSCHGGFDNASPIILTDEQLAAAVDTAPIPEAPKTPSRKE